MSPSCRHHLFEIHLTKTPKGKRVGGADSEMVTYEGGGQCSRRMCLLYALHYFKQRMASGTHIHTQTDARAHTGALAHTFTAPLPVCVCSA